MKNPFWRLFTACVCGLVAVSAAPAQIQNWVQGPDGKWHPAAPVLDERIHLSDDPPHPSHRPLDSGIGDLAGAEDLLARRLHHTHDMQALQDLVQQGLADPEVLQMLKDKFKDMRPDEVQKLQETIAKDPGLLDDPKLHDLLKNVEKFKQDGNFDDLPQGAKEDLAKWAKDFIDRRQPPDPTKVDPMTGGPTNLPPAGSAAPPPPPPPPLPADKPPPPNGAKPSWLNHDMIEAMAGLLKDVERSPEREALRDALRREFAKWDTKSSDSSALTDYLKSILSSDEAAWLARTLKPSSPNLSGSVPTPSGAPSLGESSDGMVWVAALALLVVAGWMAVAVARRQAGRARAKSWSAGPWPVQPSQVSTRQDLIRAFEHLALLLLGPAARALNHLDVAARLRDKEHGGEGKAERLAHLYEQARYAPPDEPLPADELTAARGDLTALAGAAA